MFLLREILLESQYELRLINQQVNKQQAITAELNQTVQVKLKEFLDIFKK